MRLRLQISRQSIAERGQGKGLKTSTGDLSKQQKEEKEGKSFREMSDCRRVRAR